MNENKKDLNEKNKEFEEQLNKLNRIVQKSSMNIRSNNTEFLKQSGLCEVCGLRPATINLDLIFGSHRECTICWND